MTEEQIALARRAVACKGWRWMAGMATNSKFRRVVDACPVERVPCCAEEGATYDDCHAVWLEHADLLPDLTDPATLGCLLALVREAHGAPFLQVSVSISREHGYRFECSPRHRGAWVESEEEALVAALEAAQ